LIFQVEHRQDSRLPTYLPSCPIIAARLYLAIMFMR